MSIQEVRLQQRQQQQQAIGNRNSGTYRIGDRRDSTGRTEMIYPDGSRDPNGLKLFAADHQSGDRVLTQRRSDGLWLMSEANPKPEGEQSSVFGDRRGYLDGRVFEIPEEDGGDRLLLEWTIYYRYVPDSITLSYAGLSFDSELIKPLLVDGTPLQYSVSRTLASLGLPLDGGPNLVNVFTDYFEIDLITLKQVDIAISVDYSFTNPPNQRVAFLEAILIKGGYSPPESFEGLTKGRTLATLTRQFRFQAGSAVAEEPVGILSHRRGTKQLFFSPAS